MTISVYMDDGRIFEYRIPDSPGSAREHCAAIVSGGYRHNDGEVYEHYPPHRITKVEASGPIPTNYPDTTKGT